MAGLSWNGLHVLADDVEVSTSPITEFSSNGEHIAGIADAKARLVSESDGEVQRSVVDGMSDEVHYLAMDFGIFPAQPSLPLLAACFQFSAFHRSYRCHGRSTITSDAFCDASSSAPALLPNALPLGQPLSAEEYCR